MRIMLGDIVKISNVKGFKNGYARGLDEDVEYLVIGIDKENERPILSVNNKVFYIEKLEMGYVTVSKKNTMPDERTMEVIQLEYPYIAPNNDVVDLLVKLEDENQKRSMEIAIDIALASRDYDALEKLAKYN